MFNYPLTYTAGSLGLFPKVVAVDANKKVVLFIKTKAGPVRDGKEPYKIFADEKQEQLLSQIQLNKQDKNSRLYEISKADGTKIGSVAPEKGGKWIIQSASGIPVGSFSEKNGWRRDLYYLVGGFISVLFMFIAPLKYEVELNGQLAMVLQEKFDFFNMVYTLNKPANCSESDEQLMLASLMVIFWPV